QSFCLTGLEASHIQNNFPGHEGFSMWGTFNLLFQHIEHVIANVLSDYEAPGRGLSIFERRYGSHKFASYLLATCTIATILETSVILVLQQLEIDLHSGGYLPPGPYGLIFPLFVSFFFDVPRVAQTHILGIPVTGKTLTYLLGLQVCSTSVATAISGLCGIVAGLMYRYNVLYLRRWFLVPRWLAKLSSVSVGWLLRSGAPQEGAIGATLEIQRAQQLEMLEQQVLLSRARDVRRQVGKASFSCC
ncbi:hypothetical protein ANN_04011, partial [Periplaneta americana]